MEFSNLGAHCDHPTCKQHDFLPFTCDLCHKKYCLEHRTYEAHGCEEVYRKMSIVPVCPICKQLILVKKNENPDQVVENHILRGCPKAPKSVVNLDDEPLCCHDSCKKKQITVCKFCNRTFCLDHRNEYDHNCKGLDKKPKSSVGPFINNNSSNNNSGIIQVAYDSVNNYLGNLHKERSAEKIRKELGPSPAELQRRAQPKKLPSTSSAKLDIPFSNKKLNPVGNPNVEHQNKFFIDVFFPLKAKLQPMHMYFHKDWTIGRCVDAIAEKGKIKNLNNRVPENERLNLFSLKSTERLPNSKTLQNLKDEGILQMHDPIILETGEQLSDEIIELIDDKNKATNYANANCILQ